MTPNCGVCHKDHKKGTSIDVDPKDPNFYDMKRVADAQCITCHKDLNAALKEGEKLSYTKMEDDKEKQTERIKITSFHDVHPKTVRSAEKDPGGLKFNHLYHMTTGIVLTRGGKEFTFGQMGDGKQKDAMLRRLKKTASEAAKLPVTMDCADCHSPEETLVRRREEAKDLTTEAEKQKTLEFFKDRQIVRGWFDFDPRSDPPILKPPHRDKAYMAPIKFDLHCEACHPLSFGQNLTVEHPTRKGPVKKDWFDDFEKELENKVAGWDISMPKVSIPLPGKTLTPSVLDAKQKLNLAKRVMLEGQRACGECHVDAKGHNLTAESRTIAPPNVPTEWFRHARFDHGKHPEKDSEHPKRESVGCRDCHPQAYAHKDIGNNRIEWDGAGVLAAYAKQRKGAEDVMLPGIDSEEVKGRPWEETIRGCRECHTPKPRTFAVEHDMAAKHNCTECHGYHHGKPSKK
jgi:hypothetical protein